MPALKPVVTAADTLYMLIIVSDLHLGRRPENDAAILRDLEACIERVTRDRRADDTAIEVVFLGDVFDAYVDFDGYRPERLVRWLDLVEDLQRRGVDVSYHAGNHDRWHRGTILAETGTMPKREPVVCETPAGRILLTHGDQEDEYGRFTRMALGISGAAWAHRLYTLFLPARFGNGLAAAVSRRYAHTDACESSVLALRERAFAHLEARRADVVVYGHSHRGELFLHAGGVYMNTGGWHGSRTFGVVGGTVQLMRWADGDVQVLEEAATTKSPGQALSDSKARTTPLTGETHG